MREPSLSERVRKPWKRLIDVHENPGFNREEKYSRARVSGNNRCKTKQKQTRKLNNNNNNNKKENYGKANYVAVFKYFFTF